MSTPQVAMMDGTPIPDQTARTLINRLVKAEQAVKAWQDTAIQLGNRVSVLLAQQEKQRDAEHEDTNLINFLTHLALCDQRLFKMVIAQLAKLGIAGQGALKPTCVRDVLRHEKDVYNGAVKIPRDKKGNPI